MLKDSGSGGKCEGDVKRHWETRKALEICLREELGDVEKEAGEGLRQKTFHGNKVLGARTWALRRVVYWF